MQQVEKLRIPIPDSANVVQMYDPTRLLKEGEWVLWVGGKVNKFLNKERALVYGLPGPLPSDAVVWKFIDDTDRRVKKIVQRLPGYKNVLICAAHRDMRHSAVDKVKNGDYDGDK